ncbi:MAG TPA: formate dehydrogenase subunit gamma [Telluria sp.]|nr:formate dehydrogenase subunit gamma [Telluria sp.]
MNHSTIDPAAQVNAILAASGSSQDQLLPVLHAIQDSTGFIPADAVTHVAAAFNLSRAEVHGVISFYHYFRTAAPARHVIQICRAEACQSMGGDALLAHAEQSLGCALHAHSADGSFSLEPVYCLGQCATSPAVMVNDTLHARVTPARFDSLIAKAREAA